MCDTFCVRHDAGLIFAKSSDRPVDEAQVVRWFDARPPDDDGLTTTYLRLRDEGRAATLGSQPTWMWGFEHGVNEHGVAIGNEKVWTTDDPREQPDALLGMDLVRLGLERARTADDALDVIVDLIEAHGQGGSGEEHADEPYWSSFLLVDGRGGWVLETSSRSWVAQPVIEGAAISNRLTLGTEWTRSSSDIAAGTDWDLRRAPDVPTGLADHRLAATRACVAAGSTNTPADAVATLRDHGSGPWGAPRAAGAPPQPVPAAGSDGWREVTVCMHVRGYQATTSSMVVDLPRRADRLPRVWATLGNPCVGIFLPVGLAHTGHATVAAAVAPVLSDPAAWRSFAGLARMVEVHGEAGYDALLEVRTVLDPIERDAWQSADDLWSADADLSEWLAATDRWDAAVRNALGALGRPVAV